MAIGALEAETFWLDLLRSLARGGLRGVKPVISDAHEGLKAAVTKVLWATWQGCHLHFMRNATAHTGKIRAAWSPLGSAPLSPNPMRPPPTSSSAAPHTCSAQRCPSVPS